MGELDQDMDNIAVLSIGAGAAVKDLRMGTLKSRGRGWGMLEWILPNQGNIVTTIMDGSSEASQAIVEVFFKVRKGMCALLAVTGGRWGHCQSVLQGDQGYMDTVSCQEQNVRGQRGLGMGLCPEAAVVMLTGEICHC